MISLGKPTAGVFRKVLTSPFSSILLASFALFATGNLSAADWTGARPLNTGYASLQGGSVSTDPIGDGIAVWLRGDQNGSPTELQSRTVSNTGTLGALELVTRVPVTAFQPEVHTSSNGTSTVFWTDTKGVWTAEKPLGLGWSRPELIIPGTGLSYRSAENKQGKAAVVAWRPAGQDLHPDTFLTSVERVANEAWTKPHPVISVPGHFLLADDISVSNSGDTLVAWESYQAQCIPSRHRCIARDVSLHASRLNESSSKWRDSGRLLGPYDGLIGASVTTDDAGDAGLVTYAYFTSLAQSFTQLASSVSWHGPVAISPHQPSGDFASLVVASDAAGHATVVGSTHSAQNMTVIEGSIVTNTWGTPDNIQTGGYVIHSQRLAVSANGRAVTTWANGSPIGIYGSVRETLGGPWSPPKLLTLGLDTAGDDWVDSVAIAETGPAFALFDDYNHSYTQELMYLDVFR